jgi:glycosyltransferase involved in cell wall biosynthesis
MSSILLHAWAVHKVGQNYFLPYTHYVYLNEIIKYYDKVYLLSPIYTKEGAKNEGLITLSGFKNVDIIELPPINGYIGAIRYFFKYLSCYKKLDDITTVYARYPVPFGWLQKIYLKKAKRIIHFVGDPIDATNTNPNFSKLKKKLLLFFFKPEHSLYIWACRGASVYTNGIHIADRLRKKGIIAKPLISSTLNPDDFFFPEKQTWNNNEPKIIYVGYLRRAKGIETVINAFICLLKVFPNAKLTIVGSGEFENELKNFVKTRKILNVTFLGHIEERAQLNNIMRAHDIFCFASFSEGSPRVILEAMANGLNVVSTPVGSLPIVFRDNEHLLFADFNNANMFSSKMIELINNSAKANEIRKNAFNFSHQFTLTNFLKTIFDEA